MAHLTTKTIRRNLDGATYPADGNALADVARRNHGRPDIIAALEGLPTTDDFDAAARELVTDLDNNDEGQLWSSQRVIPDTWTQPFSSGSRS